MDQNLHQTLSSVESDENLLANQKNNKPAAAATDNGCFECNICLDSAHEPVVTLCGHLYCWPCIYKWLHVQSYSDEVDNEPKCPVCKAQISQSSLVPLYGRGTSPSESDLKRPQFGMPIPRRPPPLGLRALLTSVDEAPRHHPNEPILTNPFPPQQFVSNSYGSAVSPTVGMFGEMVFARMFGADTGVFPYGNNNNYSIPANVGASRIRRQEMQLDKSLNRVSIFLFCCFILCLLLF